MSGMLLGTTTKILHDYHEVLNDIISTVSIAVLPRRGWMVNMSFELQREGHGLKHVSSQFLRDLSLTELFVVRNKIISTGRKHNEVFRDMVEEWITDVGVEIHDKPSVIKYFKDGMIQSIGLTDEALSTYNPRILKYLETQVREKCSRTSKGRLTAELLYAYRLNFAALRDLDLSTINRQPPYPLPPLNPENPEDPKAPVVTYNPTSVIFKKKKDSEATAIPLTEIGKFSSKRIIRAVAAVKLSVVKEDKSVLKDLIDLLEIRKAVETVHNTSRVRAHPSRIIMKIEGMEMNVTFKKLKKMVHVQTLEKMKKNLEQPPPENTLEQVALSTITARIEEIENKLTQKKEEEAAKRKAELKLINARAKKARKD
ncbi:hypothetical protein ACET3Z_028338 [Daucus carota]